MYVLLTETDSDRFPIQRYPDQYSFRRISGHCRRRCSAASKVRTKQRRFQLIRRPSRYERYDDNGAEIIGPRLIHVAHRNDKRAGTPPRSVVNYP